MRASYPRFHTLQKAMDTINTRIEEYLLGIRLVKAFGTEQVEETKFAKDNDQLRDSAVKAQFPIILLSPLLTFIVGIGTVIVLYWGTHLFQANMPDPVCSPDNGETKTGAMGLWRWSCPGRKSHPFDHCRSSPPQVPRGNRHSRILANLSRFPYQSCQTNPSTIQQRFLTCTSRSGLNWTSPL